MEDWDQETLEKVVESKRTKLSTKQTYCMAYYSKFTIQLVNSFFQSNVSFCHFNLVGSAYNFCT
jgi:hypothetical protein